MHRHPVVASAKPLVTALFALVGCSSLAGVSSDITSREAAGNHQSGGGQGTSNAGTGGAGGMSGHGGAGGMSGHGGSGGRAAASTGGGAGTAGMSHTGGSAGQGHATGGAGGVGSADGANMGGDGAVGLDGSMGADGDMGADGSMGAGGRMGIPGLDPLLIDDMADGDNNIIMQLGRGGWWDSAGQTDAGGWTSFYMAPGGVMGSPFAAHIEGVSGPAWSGYMLALLNNNKGYDASGYAGIHFWAKMGPMVGADSILVIQLPAVNTYPSDDPISCYLACYDLYESTVAIGPDWREYNVPFDSFSQQGWSGHAVPLLIDKLVAVTFRANSQRTFDTSVGYLSFMPK